MTIWKPFVSHIKTLPQHAIALSLLAISVPLIYVDSLTNGTDLPRYALISIITSVSTLIFLLSYYKIKFLYLNKLFFIPLALLAWATTSIIWSVDAGNSQIELLRFASSILILFLAMQVHIYQQQSAILYAAFIGFSIIAILGLLQSFDINPFELPYRGIPASTFVNPNHVSIYLEVFVPILFIFLLYKTNKKEKVIATIGLSIILPYLYILSSFGTFLALLFSMLFSCIILNKKTNFSQKIKNNYLYLIVILLATVSINLAYTFLPTSTQHSGKSISLITQKSSHKVRLALDIKSLNAIKDNPLTGFGYGGFRAGIIPYIADVQSITGHNERYAFEETHNDFMQQFTELGIIAGTLFLVFFILVLRIGFNSINNEKISDNNIFTFAISAGLLVLILHSFIDFPFHLSSSNFLIYLISGLILSSVATKTLSKPSLIQNLIFAFSSASVLTYLVVAFNFNSNHINSNKLVKDSAIALHREKNCAKAIKRIDKSNQIFSLDFVSQASQAQIYGVCPQAFSKQKRVIQQLVNTNPTNFRARFLLGNILLVENSLEAALQQYFYIVENLPHSALGYIGLGKLAIKKKQYNNAQVYLKRAQAIEPENSYVNSTLKSLNDFL